MPRPLRAVGLGAVASAAALSLSACGWASPIQTQQSYAASDGVRVDLADGVRVENLMVVTGGNFEDGWVLGTVANDTTEEVTVAFELAGSSEDVTVPAESAEAISFAADGLEEPAGATTPATITFAGATTRAVPVLDGTTSPYDEFAPEG